MYAGIWTMLKDVYAQLAFCTSPVCQDQRQILPPTAQVEPAVSNKRCPHCQSKQLHNIFVPQAAPGMTTYPLSELTRTKAIKAKTLILEAVNAATPALKEINQDFIQP